MEKGDKIAVIGEKGMLTSALFRRLKSEGFKNLVLMAPEQADLTDQQTVLKLFQREKPSYVFLTSVKTGGIIANSKYPAEFIYRNMQTQTNVIHCSWKLGVRKLFYLGSSCMYPRESPQSMKEEYLLSGKLEPTSEPYAIAKIAGMKMCQSYNAQYKTDYVTAIPADLYGLEDDFDPETSHVLPALIRRMHEAKTSGQAKATIWGSGAPRREFLYADDFADACLFLMNNYDSSETINIGFGEDTSIKELALAIKEVVGYSGEIAFDTSKPDGAPRKFLSSDRIRKLGWKPQTSLEKGIEQTYSWYLSRLSQ